MAISAKAQYSNNRKAKAFLKRKNDLNKCLNDDSVLDCIDLDTIDDSSIDNAIALLKKVKAFKKQQKKLIDLGVDMKENVEIQTKEAQIQRIELYNDNYREYGDLEIVKLTFDGKFYKLDDEKYTCNHGFCVRSDKERGFIIKDIKDVVVKKMPKKKTLTPEPDVVESDTSSDTSSDSSDDNSIEPDIIVSDGDNDTSSNTSSDNIEPVVVESDSKNSDMDSLTLKISEYKQKISKLENAINESTSIDISQKIDKKINSFNSKIDKLLVKINTIKKNNIKILDIDKSLTGYKLIEHMKLVEEHYNWRCKLIDCDPYDRKDIKKLIKNIESSMGIL
jgi:hypothetical protein